ncbi:MAG: excinuclease ABC subunit UvrC [Planctomycetota bacterium]|nr:excinuclease ABC subunit UvrC [Planctomycetota bacterium]
MPVSPDLPEPLRSQLADLPAEPGVYIFTDDRSKTVYVGKAVNLRSRVRSYFQPGANDGRFLFSRIVNNTHSIDFIVCSNELEALLLENNLIKKHRPLYNLRLRDDKTYLSLRVTTGEKWPRVHPTRRWKDDGHTYFGPYSSSRSVYELLRMIKKYIPLRTCTNAFFESRTRPCIEHEIGRCTAPCVGLDEETAYGKMVEEVLLLLRGRNQALLDLLDAKMQEASKTQKYESAAHLRDQISAVEKILQQQNVQEHSQGDCDVIGIERSDGIASIHVLLVREGRVISSATHTCRSTQEQDGQLLSSFLGQYYHGDKFIPVEILVPVEPEGREVIEKWLASKAKRKVQLKVPRRGSKVRLLEMARKNASVRSRSDGLKLEANEQIATRLGTLLGNGEPVRTIECYDISNIQGTLSVASRVFFEDCEPDTELYRRYRIRTVHGSDDFASMEEVLHRRFRPSEKRDLLPDLVVVDGGKGQLSRAVAVLKKHQLDVIACGLAKDRVRAGEHTTERVYLPGQSQPIDLPEDDPASRLLQRIRDEAHRFANSYHRELRQRTQLVSGLEEIPGIGPRRRRALMRCFGSLSAIGDASLEQLAAVEGLTPAIATSLHAFLNSPDDSDLAEELLEVNFDEGAAAGAPPEADS